jgi:hypothetical protein
MGDRAQLCVVASYPTHGGVERHATWVYTHWTGETMPERVRDALQRGKPRYGAPLYLTRILYDAVVLEPGTLDGYALGPRPLDTEPGRPVLVVDLDRREVGVATLDRRSMLPTIERSIPWADYIARKPRTWGRDLLAK